MIVCGIDYSLTSPAIAVHDGNSWDVSNCRFYFMAHKAKQVITTSQFYGTSYPKYDCDTQRYDNLASWSIGIITSAKVENAFVEGYAFGAVGRVFQIAENAGLLKYNMWKQHVPFGVFAPSEIKKHATGKGNSTKEALYDAFLEETSIDVRQILGITNKNDWNPLSDIVDSYYIAKLGFMKENGNANHP
jgi:Holliday junction resolvasome RuvABC endonuclease subunit